MGKKLNLSHLTDVERDQIMNVLQKDFENRRHEKKRISEVHDELLKEQSRIALLKENKKFIETSCIICLERFGVIFHRKRICYRCSLNICSECSHSRSGKKKGFICQVCQKEKEYKMLSNQWFYNSTQVNDKTYGSSTVVRSLNKKATPALSDTDVDSGYSPSLVSSEAPSKPPRLRLDSAFDNRLNDEDNNETSTEVSSTVANQVVPRQRTYVLDTASKSQHVVVPVPRARKQKDNSTPDLYKEALDDARRSVEFKFRVDFDELLEDLRESLEEKEPDGLSTNLASSSGEEMMLMFKDKVKELLKGFSERLQVSFENCGSAESPASIRENVNKNMCKCIEDIFGGDIDLTSDEAISDLHTLSNDSSTDGSSFEDIVALVVVSRMLENRKDVNKTCVSPEKDNISVTSLKYLSAEDQFHQMNARFNCTISDYDKNNENNSDDGSVYSHGSIHNKLRETSSSMDNPHLPSYQGDLLPDDTDEESDKYFDKVNSKSEITKANIDNNGSNRFYSRECTKSDTNVKTKKKSEQSHSLNSEAEYDDESSLKDERNVDEESNVVTEFQELKNFVKNTSRRPKVEAVTFDDSDLYEVEEETVIKTEIDQDELAEEFHARYSVFDRINNSEHMLPDISQFDNTDYDSDEIDPDLLSLNLEIIPEETEEELGQEMETKSEHANWIFKSKGLLPYTKLRKKEDKMDSQGSTFMRVPSPHYFYVPMIGNSTDDQFSDFSDLEGSEDEENTFYANTSKELARIARQQNRLSHSHWLQPGYHSDDSDFHDKSGKQKAPPLSGQSSGDNTDSMEHSSRPLIDPNKQQIKLLQDLILAENDNPKFVVVPESVTIQEGEPVKFSCRVTGTGHIDVFWYREGNEVEELDDSADVEITNDGDKHSIVLYNISKKMGCQYICIAVNEQGKAIQYLVVTIKDNKQELKKPEFLKGLKDVEVTEGQSVKFRVKVKGYPPPRISWYKDGELLKASKSCRIEKFGNRDYILIIDHASMDDDAEYTVIARNVAGEQKMSAQVIVDPKSDLVVKKQNLSTTTSGVSDSDSDLSMPYRSLILASSSATPITPTTTAITSAKSTVQQREFQLHNNLDRNTTLTQKKAMDKPRSMHEELENPNTTSKRLLTSEVMDVLRIAEDIIQNEKHTSVHSTNQMLIKEVSVSSCDNNVNNNNTSSTLYLTHEIKPGHTEDLVLQDIFNDFCLPICGTQTLTQNQPSFDFSTPEIHKQKVLRDQYSRDFEMPRTASYSPQTEEIHRYNKTERIDERGDSSSQCSSPRQSIDSGVYVSSQQEQISHISVSRPSNKNELAVSQIELASPLELPSVDTLKAVFSSAQDDDDLGNGSLKRVHSITARNVPKEQLEKLRASNQSQSSASSSNKLEASVAATQVFINLDQHKDPVLIYSANELQQQTTAKSGPISKSGTTTLFLQPSQQQASKQVSKNTIKHLATSPQLEKSGLVKPSVVSHGESETTHKTGPRIKTGCISARAAFWERKIAAGEALNDDEFPDMVESSDV